MKNSQEKMPYLSDGELYSIWKYLNGHRLVGKRGVLNFDDIKPEKGNKFFITNLLYLLKSIGVSKLKGLVFHKEIYLKYHKGDYRKLKERKEKKELDAPSLRALNFLEELLADNVDFFMKVDLIILILFYLKIF